MTPNALLEQTQTQVGRAVTGYADTVRDLLIALAADGHVLLEGIPGIAKTTLAKTFAKTTGLTFTRIQFTQDVLPADVTGHSVFNESTRSFETRRGPVFTNVLLADEINRAPPKTQSALLEAMGERQVTIEGETYALEEPFMVVATMNPVDSEGVYRLPEAQLDRFMLRTRMSYLPEEMELDMLAGKTRDPREPERLLDRGDILQMMEATRRVRAERPLLRYIQQIGLATRADARVALGASPRALEHTLAAARALAHLQGRDYAIPDDVKAVAPRSIPHRLFLEVDAEMDGVTPESAVQDVLETVEVPKLDAPTPA